MTSQFFVRLISVLLVTGLLSACASDKPRTRAEKERAVTEQLSQIPTLDISSRLYSQALNLKSAGDCALAIPLFHRLSMRGEGFELAHYHLADCLFKTAPESATDTRWIEALLWMRRAADAGVPQAQGALAALYATGPDNARNLAEAAMWYQLFKNNPARKKPGFSSNLDRMDIIRIENALTGPALAEGEARAANFTRFHWSPPDQKPASGPAMRDEEKREDGGIELLSPDEKRPNRTPSLRSSRF